MPITGALVAGGIGAAANIYGAKKASDTSKEAQRAADAKFKEIEAALAKIGIPSVEAQKIILTDPQMVGELVPEMEGKVAELQTAMSDVSTDPRLAQAQMDALGGLQQRAEGGLTAADIADINELRRKSTGALQGQDASIMQNMEQRGLGGAGSELAMRLAAKESTQSQASEEADRLAAANYNAKMAALQGMGSMAGNIRGQDFNEQANKAQAQDAISKFNQQNQMNVEQRNVDRSNQAQASNLATKQGLEAQRAANRSQEDIHNKGLIQQDYQNQLQKVGIQNGVNTQAANNITQSGATQSANTAKTWGAVGDIALSAGKAWADSQKPTVKKPKVAGES